MARTKPTASRVDSVEPLAPATTAERAAATTYAGLPQAGWLTAEWVKSYYQISNSTLYKWISDSRKGGGKGNGFPAPVKIGPRAVRWRAEALRAYEAALQAGE